MIELRTYTKAELSEILKTNSRQGMTRKLDRWGVIVRHIKRVFKHQIICGSLIA